MSDTESRFSLVAGEGDGAMLGLVAGDTAGGAWELGYSALTEQATVIAYHLIEPSDFDITQVEHAIRELDGSDVEEPVYRAESTHFRSWLAREPRDRPPSTPSPHWTVDRGPSPLASHSGGSRKSWSGGGGTGLAVPCRPGVGGNRCGAAERGGGLMFRPGREGPGGWGRRVDASGEPVGGDARQWLGGGMGQLIDEVNGLMDFVPSFDADGALAAVGSGPAPGPWELLKAGLLLAAPQVDRPHVPVEHAARIGGSPLAAIVGGIIGARVGIRAWPWAFANDTWFAEIGRRLVRGPWEVRDLPIPYAVEQHLISGERDFH